MVREKKRFLRSCQITSVHIILVKQVHFIKDLIFVCKLVVTVLKMTQISPITCDLYIHLLCYDNHRVYELIIILLHLTDCFQNKKVQEKDIITFYFITLQYV